MTGSVFGRLARLFSSPAPAPATPGPRPVVVILGMHNAGTSVLSQIAAKLGVVLGDDLLMRSRYENPPAYDYWEHAGIVETQDALLKALGHHPGERGGYLPIDPQLWFQPQIRRYRDTLRDLTAREVDAAGTAPFGFKDPRTARLMPLWHGIFAELSLVPKFLIGTRASSVVTRSFAKKNGQPLARGEALWSRTYLEALIASRGFERLILRYEDWTSRGEQMIATLDDFLGLQGDRAAALAAINLEISDFRDAGAEPLSALSAGIETLLTRAGTDANTKLDEDALWAACNYRDAHLTE